MRYEAGRMGSAARYEAGLAADEAPDGYDAETGKMKVPAGGCIARFPLYSQYSRKVRGRQGMTRDVRPAHSAYSAYAAYPAYGSRIGSAMHSTPD